MRPIVTSAVFFSFLLPFYLATSLSLPSMFGVRNSTSTTKTPGASSYHVSVNSNLRLMTCEVIVQSPQGTVMACVLWDTGSSASFMSEHLAQALHWSRYSQNALLDYSTVTGGRLLPNLLYPLCIPPAEGTTSRHFHCSPGNW